MHLSTVSVPIGTAVSVGTSTKLTLAGIGRRDKKIIYNAPGKHVYIRVDNVMDSFFYCKHVKKRNLLDSRKICKMMKVLF